MQALARLAQSVERTTLNRVVGGSIPPSGATFWMTYNLHFYTSTHWRNNMVADAEACWGYPVQYRVSVLYSIVQDFFLITHVLYCSSMFEIKIQKNIFRSITSEATCAKKVCLHWVYWDVINQMKKQVHILKMQIFIDSMVASAEAGGGYSLKNKREWIHQLQSTMDEKGECSFWIMSCRFSLVIWCLLARVDRVQRLSP